MEITLVKAHDHTQLTCVRKDGTYTRARLGPDFPHHDLSHFVVEIHFRLRSGFFGLIESGYTIQELSDPQIIPTLGQEIMLSEVLVRNLQGLSNGSIEKDQYVDVVSEEMLHINLKFPFQVSDDDVQNMVDRLDALLEQWKSLRITESLSIQFHIN